MTHQPSLLPEPPGRYARVAVPAPLDREFTYRLREPLDAAALPGCRVRVQFGGRPLVGVVVETIDELDADLDPATVRDVVDCLDREPSLPPALLTLAERVARDNLVGWGEVLALALPGFGDPSAGGRVRLLKGPESAGADPDRRLLLALRSLGGGSRWVRLVDLLRRVQVDAPVGRLSLLARRGVVQVEDEWEGREPGALQNVVSLRPVPSGVVERQTARAPAQRRVLEWLSEQGRGPAVESALLRELGVSASVLAGLEGKGLVERNRQVRVDPGPGLGDDGAGSFRLTAEQEAALAAIEAGSHAQPVLLHGVTGSGKTEVYLRAASACLAEGRGAILLVPEIGLTPQLEARARAVLGDEVAVLHSGMSRGERLRAWWRLRTGQARVAVGPRSAAFAPVGDVGLIVVDEEQDGAYKQDERPRYSGRDVAVWRSEIEGATVVLGSATPSVESYQAAVEGSWRLQRMPARVESRPLPEVRMVDMREEWRASGRNLLSRRLHEALGERLGRSEQSLVLLNRRGFAAVLICRACGDRAECPRCSVTLTLHRGERALRCHYCDHREPVRRVCSQCGSDALHDLGFGTERLHHALERAFPRARIGRFDADQTQRRGAHGRILAAFAAGELDLLVGTQMLAKGHDFPGVTLVGVVGADAALGMPDFRAAERTFQLLTQMAGRAGRGELAGEVLLQAHEPDHYALRSAAGHDYDAFFEREIAFRRQLRYPPFSALALCVCRGKVLAVAKEEADRLAGALRAVAAGAIQVLGPATPPIARLRDKYRLQLLLKGAHRDELVLALGEALRDLGRRRQEPRDLVVDIDPRNLM